MPIKTIHRYEHRAYQKGHVEILRTDEFRLSRLSPAHTALRGDQAGRWCLTWLAERWVIDFPEGLRRHRGGEDPLYWVEGGQSLFTLAQVVNLARHKHLCEILSHQQFPVPGAVSRANAALQEEWEEP